MTNPTAADEMKLAWGEPLLNKMHRVERLYYKLKGIVLYRLLFKEFGPGSYIRRPILISNPSFIAIGKRVSIRDGVRLEIVRTDSSREPELIIEDNTNIEQNVHIVCHNRIWIGRNVSITPNCAIVDVSHPFADVRDPTKIGDRIQEDDSFVEIGNGAFIGFGSVILPNVRIGTHSIIGANSVVVHDVPDYSVAAGAPATIRRQYDFRKKAWVKVPSSVIVPLTE